MFDDPKLLQTLEFQSFNWAREICWNEPKLEEDVTNKQSKRKRNPVDINAL